MTEWHDVVVHDALRPPSAGMAAADRLLGGSCCCSESWKRHRSTCLSGNPAACKVRGAKLVKGHCKHCRVAKRVCLRVTTLVGPTFRLLTRRLLQGAHAWCTALHCRVATRTRHLRCSLLPNSTVLQSCCLLSSILAASHASPAQQQGITHLDERWCAAGAAAPSMFASSVSEVCFTRPAPFSVQSQGCKHKIASEGVNPRTRHVTITVLTIPMQCRRMQAYLGQTGRLAPEISVLSGLDGAG
jgi:hypothetical protein